MWFKRTKKTEQDHALSESLRSLQTLLRETDRHEPSLDSRDNPVDESEADASVDPPPGSRAPLATAPRPGTGPDTAFRDVQSGEPETPGGSGNRWRDLSLSFDAEPVLPRTRRDGNGGAADQGAEPEPAIEPGSSAGETPRRPEPEADHSGATTEPDLHVDEAASDATELPEPAPGDTDAAVDGDEVPPGYDFHSRSDDEVLVIDLDEPESPGDGGDVDEPVELDDPTQDDPTQDEAAVDGSAQDAPSSEPPALVPGDETAEDQLPLELEPTESSEADIPVLTNAVYVPDKAPAQPAPPGPATSPHEARIEHCIDNLRVRFQLMGLDALSAGQEKELHDTLVELLDELGRD